MDRNDLKSGDFVITEYGNFLDYTLKVKAQIWKRKGIFLNKVKQSFPTCRDFYSEWGIWWEWINVSADAHLQ